MGTFISAILSSFTKDSTNTTTNEEPLEVKPKITKRKSKPELMIHRPSVPSSSPHVVHEFIWKYGGREVFLAGTFTDWKPTIEMVPCDANREYWRALVELDPGCSWEFKFVVDGIWRCSLDLPTATDPAGNTNNIIRPI